MSFSLLNKKSWSPSVVYLEYNNGKWRDDIYAGNCEI